MAAKKRQPPRQSARGRNLSTNDGLVNVVSGLGTNKSKRSHTQFHYAMLNNWQQLDAAYQSNWLARAICDIPAEDMTREWRTIKCDGADAIRAEEDRVHIQSSIGEASSWARLYGGAVILMLTGQNLEQPLDPGRVKKGGLIRLMVFDRWDVTPLTMNTYNVLAANYMLPEYYVLTGGAQKVHWTHFARFEGAKLPRRQRVQTMGWGASELQCCIEDIMDTVSSKDGIAELMQEANIDVITRQGLLDELSSDQDDVIVSRYSQFSLLKSNFNMALLDGDEKFERMTLNLSGVSSVLEVFMTWISGAAKIPLTRLFGTSAKGMNATGEGDTTNYHSSLASQRMSQIDPGLRTLDEVLVRSALGYWPDDFNFEWNPLKQPDLVQIAQANKANAERDVMYKDAGVVQVSQIQRRLQAEELYQFQDDKITELEELEDETMFDDPPEGDDDNPDAPPVAKPEPKEPEAVA